MERVGDLYRLPDNALLREFDLPRIRHSNDERTLYALAQAYNLYDEADSFDTRFRKVAQHEYAIINKIDTNTQASKTIDYEGNIFGERYIGQRARNITAAFQAAKIKAIRDYLVGLPRTVMSEYRMARPEPILTARNFAKQPIPAAPVAPAAGELASLIRPASVEVQPARSRSRSRRSDPMTRLQPIIGQIREKIGRGVPRKRFLGIPYRNAATSKRLRSELRRNVARLKSEMGRQSTRMTGRQMDESMTALQQASAFAKSLGYPLEERAPMLEGARPGEFVEGGYVYRFGGGALTRRAGGRAKTSRSMRSRSRRRSSGGRAGTRRQR